MLVNIVYMKEFNGFAYVMRLHFHSSLLVCEQVLNYIVMFDCSRKLLKLMEIKIKIETVFSVYLYFIPTQKKIRVLYIFLFETLVRSRILIFIIN